MIAQRVANLKPYVPGEQPGPLPDGGEYIKLNANENPYPPSPEVASALSGLAAADLRTLARYPDPDSTALRGAIAGLLNQTGGVLCRTRVQTRKAASGLPAFCLPAPEDVLPFEVTPDMIFTGNGSDEVLSFIFYAFFDSDRPLIAPQHTYSFYPVYAGYYGIPLKTVPLKADFSIDPEALIAEARATQSSILLANPNAPTGIDLSRNELRMLLEGSPADRAVVIDEAYADFGGQSALPLLADFPNLVIVRTFSKSLSFAGMRLGFAAASPELIRALTGVKNSFNHFPVDALAQAAGAAACKDAAWYAENAGKIVRERDAFAAFLRERRWLVLPSRTNFLFARLPGFSGRMLYEKIREQGVLVRHFAVPGIEDFIRISIGTAEEMAALRNIVAEILKC
jgi:histidinol-phosphate aminotransferase